MVDKEKIQPGEKEEPEFLIVRPPTIAHYLKEAYKSLADRSENYGVAPDVFIKNTPEDELKGFDRELKTAVDEALKMPKEGKWQYEKEVIMSRGGCLRSFGRF